MKANEDKKEKQIELLHAWGEICINEGLLNSTEIVARKNMTAFSHPVPSDNVEKEDWLGFI